MRVYSIFAIILLVSSLAGVVSAAENAKVTLDAQGVAIQQAMADVAKQSGVEIMCDSDVKATVNGNFNSMELEKLLNVVTKSSDLKWQKVYLPSEGDKKPTLEQVKARAAAIAAVTGAFAVYDPATGKQKVFVEQEPTGASVDPAKLGLKPVYFVSKPQVAAKEAKPDSTQSKQDGASRMQEIQNQRMNALAAMTPEERTKALQQEMLFMTTLDPRTRQQMVLDQVNARRSMDRQTRDAYQQMMRDTYSSLRDQGLLPNNTGRRGGRNRGGGNQRTGN